MKGKTLLTVFIIVAVATVGYRWLPPYYNPFMPLTLDDPPGRITQYKLRRLTPEACASLLSQANQRDLIRTQPVADSGGACPLNNVVRVRDFGPVSLNSSFLASCPMAVASTMYALRSREQTLQQMQSPLVRISHVGSYACRNIYHRTEGRLSEHATADAWDVTGFQLANGQRLTVSQHWQQPTDKAAMLHTLWRGGCQVFGNALGPDYNAAHTTHFHLGMRGAGYCR